MNQKFYDKLERIERSFKIIMNVTCDVKKCNEIIEDLKFDVIRLTSSIEHFQNIEDTVVIENAVNEKHNIPKSNFSLYPKHKNLIELEDADELEQEENSE